MREGWGGRQQSEGEAASSKKNKEGKKKKSQFSIRHAMGWDSSVGGRSGCQVGGSAEQGAQRAGVRIEAELWVVLSRPTESG